MLDSGDGENTTAVLPAGVLNAVIELSDDAVIVIGDDGTVTSWSRPAERLFGYTPDEIVGRLFVTLIADHECERLATVITSMLSGEHIRRFETSAMRKDGMPVPISLSARAVQAERDSPLIAVVVVSDITEQRLAQAALAEVEGRLRESETLAGVGSWLWDVGSGAMQWSDEAHRLHSVDPLDFDGTFESHIARVHVDDRERVRNAMQVAVSSGRPFDEEYRIDRPNGEVRHVRARAQPTYGAAANALGLRGVVQDVTDRSDASRALSSRGR